MPKAIYLSNKTVYQPPPSPAPGTDKVYCINEGIGISESIVPVLPVAAHWVSPTGIATWANSYGTTPLSGAACCSLSTANANASAGDTVILRGGSYLINDTTLGDHPGIYPAHSGTDINHRVIFSAYASEIPIIEQQNQTYYTNGYRLNGVNWVKLDGIWFKNFQLTNKIHGGGSYNEVVNCRHYTTADFLAASNDRTLVIGDYAAPWSTHNWVHHNYFQGHHNANPCGEAIDGIRVGNAEYSPPDFDRSDYNTIEDNYFANSGHANIVTYSHYNVVRNNIGHNEPWIAGCTVYQMATSTTSLTVGTGSKTLTTQAGLSPDVVITLLDSANYANAMWGIVTAYDSGTGAMTVNVYYSVGSGTKTSWILSQHNIPYYETSAFNGKYGHRVTCFGDEDTGHDNWNLIEGNRFGFGSVNPNNGGADCLDIESPRNIVRFNDVYASMASGILFKGANPSVPSGGVNNCVYNNTAYHNGHGWNTQIYGAMNMGYNGNGIAQYRIGTGQTNNKIKNNIAYDNGHGDICAAGTLTPPQAPETWDTVIGNLTGTDPNFTNPDLTDPTSQNIFSDLSGYAATPVPDLTLQGGSPAINNGVALTTAVGAGAGSLTLVVADADYFQDGTKGSALSGIQADWIAIGTVGNVVQISSINYDTKTITLASAKTWSDGASVWLYKKSDGVRVLYGTAPDQGAHPYPR